MTDAPQDFTKPITIVLAGTGSATKEHIDATFENLIFSGLGPTDDRYVRVLVPFDEPTSGQGVTQAVEWFTHTVQAEELIGVVGVGSKLVAKMQTAIKAEEGITTSLSALEFALNAAAGYLNSSEVFFFSFYDPENPADLEQVQVVKNYQGIRTANVCLAGTDVFENYESTDERIIREKAEAAFAAEVAAETAKAPAKKAVAKKAAAPRRKAVPKALVSEDVPLLPTPQKAVQSPSEPLPEVRVHVGKQSAQEYMEGLDKLIAGRVAKEEEDRKARAMKESLAVFLPDDDGLIDQDHRNPGVPSIDSPVPQVVGSDKVLVKKEDLLRLLDVLTDIVKGM